MLRKPFANSIHPHRTLWFRLTGRKYEALRQITGLSGAYYQMNCHNDTLDGHYRVLTRKQTLFVKVVNINASEAHIFAEKISHFVNDNNINTVCCVNGFPRTNYDYNVLALAYPFIESHYLKPTTAQMGWMGAELGKLHQALFRIPAKHDIKRNSDKCFELCLSNVDLLCHNLKSLDVNTSAITETIDHLMHKSFMRSPQVIHGDLNYGNVLTRDDDHEKIIFIDFEEASRSYFSPMIDVAMVIERFIVPSQNTPNTLLYEFKKNYTAVTGNWFENSDQLAGLLRSLSARALLLLESVADDEEWRAEERFKFLTLHQNAIDNFRQLSSWST